MRNVGIMANKVSCCVLQGLPKKNNAQALALLCERVGLPESLKERYGRLGVVPPDTPLPMTMLKRLWGLASETDAEATANLFESKVLAVFDVNEIYELEQIFFCLLTQQAFLEYAENIKLSHCTLLGP